jgi:hypothetical protein
MLLARLKIHLDHLFQHPSELARPKYLLGLLRAMNNHLHRFPGNSLTKPELVATRSSGSEESIRETVSIELSPPDRDPFILLLRSYQPQRLPISVDVFAPKSRMKHHALSWRFFASNGLRCHPMFEDHLDFLRADLMPQMTEAIEGAIISIELENRTFNDRGITQRR